MSDATPAREWRFYLDDMLLFCSRIQLFTDGITQDDFAADIMRFDATVRNIELIGEAATHIPEGVRQTAPQLPWRMMVATRNQLIHGYLGIDNDTLWSIVTTDVPTLTAALTALKKQLSP